MPFVAIPACVTFASHMFRLNVARARFCFNFCLTREISVLAATMAEARLGTPDVTRRRMYLETMERVLGGTDKIIIDGKSGQGVVPFLPLDQLQKRKEGAN